MVSAIMHGVAAAPPHGAGSDIQTNAVVRELSDVYASTHTRDRR